MWNGMELNRATGISSDLKPVSHLVQTGAALGIITGYSYTYRIWNKIQIHYARIYTVPDPDSSKTWCMEWNNKSLEEATV